MREIDYNEHTKLGVEHIPIYASSNVVTGTKYMTHLYLLQNGSRYPLGTWNEKLDDEQVLIRFAEIVYRGREEQYGQQNTVLRKDLKPRRDRGKVGNAMQQAAHAGQRGSDITKLDR